VERNPAGIDYSQEYPVGLSTRFQSLITIVASVERIARTIGGIKGGWSRGQPATLNHFPNCQGFAMSKQRDYCQLFGSDGGYEASDPSNPDAQITHGDSSYSEYACYIKKH
jgi:hypothetical protein